LGLFFNGRAIVHRGNQLKKDLVHVLVATKEAWDRR